MLCQKCKNNYATTSITRIINGVKQEIYLCSVCAFKAGYSNLFSNFSLDSLDEFNTQKRCLECKSSLDEIMSSGKIGCSNCYKTFKEELMPTIIKLHGRGYHMGKKPHSIAESKKTDLLNELQMCLEDAIQAQEFERAALLRDEIKKYNKEK